MKLNLAFFFITTCFMYSQSSYQNYWKDLRSFDEHLNNAKELYRFANEEGYAEMAYLEILKAIKLNSESSESYTIKGALNLHKGDYYTAIEDLNRSILLGSKDGCTYYYRAVARIELPSYHKDNTTSKYCADLITANALGGCSRWSGALYSHLEGNCK